MTPFNEYTPGEIYSLGIAIQSGEAGRVRWGFQTIPLDGTNAMAGSLTPGSGTFTGAGGGGRTYVHHLNAPSSGPGGANWTFTWTAPASDVGDVTFYACGNAADGLGSTGDFIECPTFTITPVAGPLDSDMDGLSNLEEMMIGTNPNDPDTDGDGLLDGQEVNTTLTNPLEADTDGDGCDDGDEDLNGDGILDPGETDPLNPGDCGAAPLGLMRVARTLGDPPTGAAHAVFDLMPCTVASGDMAICDEFTGTIDELPDPLWPVTIGGAGVLVFIEYDEDTSVDGTVDSIRVSKNPASPDELIVSRP